METIETAPPAAPAGDAPSAPIPRPPLLAALLSVAVWFCVILGHLLACSRLAHLMGSPQLMPAWLASLNRFFQTGIESGFDLVWATLWMALVVVLAIPVLLLWLQADQVTKGTRFEGASDVGIFTLWPVILVTVFTLLILPFESHNLPQSPTGLQLAEALTFDAFLETIFQGCFSLICILVLFFGLGVAASFFATSMPDGGVWQLIAAILFGITLSMIFGLVLGPYALALSEKTGRIAAIAALLGLWGLMTGLPLFVVSRRA